MSPDKPKPRRTFSKLTGYAPRLPHPALLHVIEILAAANRSDRCIVSIEKIRELARTRFQWAACRRTISYHIKAAIREHLIVRQGRWIKATIRTERRGRSVYRLAWRHFQRLGRAARAWAGLAPGIVAPGRRETVQKVAQGVQDLLRSVVPLGYPPPARA